MISIPDDTNGLKELLTELQTSFKDNKTRSYEFRLQQLQNMMLGLKEMEEELCQAIEKDLGRGPFFAYISEVHLVKTEIQHTIDHMKDWMKDQVVDTPIGVGPGKSYIKYEPLGVVLIMSAWNYPYYCLLGPLSQVIAAGNCAVLKPSEISPNCCKAMFKFCQKYLDQKYYRPIYGQTEVAKLITALRFDKIVFTGSTEKGKLVAQAAAKNLVPCVLELGGKSPAIIDESCDAALAAKKVLFGKMPNLGQVCIAPDYIMCHESKINIFIESFKKQLEKGYNNCQTSAESGKMVNEFHLKRVCSLMENHGGEVILGNKNAHIDFDLKPTIILNPSKDSKLMKEEIFGPIFPIILYTNIDEAIKYISEEQEKPLTVYYFGQRNGINQEKVINGTSSGSLVVNDTIYQIMNAYLPFGGVGQSGYGRYHGEEGFKTFSNMKSILVKPSLDCFPFDQVFPPYDEAKQKIILKTLNFGTITQQKFFNIMIGSMSAITLITLLIYYRNNLLIKY